MTDGTIADGHVRCKNDTAQQSGNAFPMNRVPFVRSPDWTEVQAMNAELLEPRTKKHEVGEKALSADGQRKLLIVDDKELTCKQMQQLLQGGANNLQVTYQTDSHKALEELT